MNWRIKTLLENNLSPKSYETVRSINRSVKSKIEDTKRLAKSRIFAGNLTELAKIHETDKWGSHWYAPHYERHFKDLRKKKLRILEIGVGGYADPSAGGASLRMWKYYFPKSSIYALDIV